MSFHLGVVTQPEKVATVWAILGLSISLGAAPSAQITVAGYATQEDCDNGVAPLATVNRRISTEDFDKLLAESVDPVIDAAEKWLLETPEVEQSKIGIPLPMLDPVAKAFAVSKSAVEKSGAVLQKSEVVK
jgi:hypothetical protein